MIEIMSRTGFSALGGAAYASPWDNTLDCTGAELLVIIHYIPTVSAMGTIALTCGGVSLTKQVQQNADDLGSAMWTLANPGTGNKTIRMTSNAGDYDTLMVCYLLAGLDPTTPILGTASVGGVKPPSSAGFYSTPGQLYTVNQPQKRDSLAIVTALIAGLTGTPSTFDNGNGGVPVFPGGMDEANEPNLGGAGFHGALFEGYDTFSGIGDLDCTVVNNSLTLADSHAGGVMIALQGQQHPGGQILTMD